MKNEANRAPLVTHLSWGRMEIEGVGTGKDFKLWPGGGRPWDWGETGTRHEPGIQPADVSELLEHGCRVVVLSQGMLLALKTCDQTLRELEMKHIDVHVAETSEAVEIYNRLATDGAAVGGLFHSTC